MFHPMRVDLSDNFGCQNNRGLNGHYCKTEMTQKVCLFYQGNLPLTAELTQLSECIDICFLSRTLLSTTMVALVSLIYVYIVKSFIPFTLVASPCVESMRKNNFSIFEEETKSINFDYHFLTFYITGILLLLFVFGVNFLYKQCAFTGYSYQQKFNCHGLLITCIYQVIENLESRFCGQ